MILAIVQLLLVLGLMVLVHEFGHFIVAKWCGVRVEAFAIGFGKRLVGYVHKGTDYRINALPLGGYVKMAGEIPGEETSDDPGDLNNHPRWQRMLIALAGPVANFILAFGLMAGYFMAHNEVDEYRSGPAVTDYISPSTPLAQGGLHSGDTIVHFEKVENPTWEDILNRAKLNLNQTVALSYVHDGKRTDTKLRIAFSGTPDDFALEDAFALGLVPRMQEQPLKVKAPTPGTPAERAGLQPGDQILSVGNLPIRSTPVLLNYLTDQKGKPVVLNLLRGQNHVTMVVKPELMDLGDGTKGYRLGFQVMGPPVHIENLPFKQAVRESWSFNKKSSVLIFDVLKKMFQRQISVKSLSGPIGIGQVVHEAAKSKEWMPLIGTVAQISINLGMFNLLPFPILDGGMIFLLIVESIFRRDLPMPIKERIYQVAFVCIVLFAAMVIFNDISKLPFVAKMKS